MRGRDRGQALVEFSAAFIVFAMLVFGILDLGRGIYQFNGASQAAREISRVTSVYPGSALGASAETARVIAVQKALIPYLRIDAIECVDATGQVETGACDYSRSWVRVTVSSPFKAFTPPLGFFPGWTMQASSTAQIQ